MTRGFDVASFGVATAGTNIGLEALLGAGGGGVAPFGAGGSGDDSFVCMDMIQIVCNPGYSSTIILPHVISPCGVIDRVVGGGNNSEEDIFVKLGSIASEVDAAQAAAARENPITNGGEVFSAADAGQTRTATEDSILNLGNTVRKVDAGRATVRESIITDGGDRQPFNLSRNDEFCVKADISGNLHTVLIDLYLRPLSSSPARAVTGSRPITITSARSRDNTRFYILDSSFIIVYSNLIGAYHKTNVK